MCDEIVDGSLATLKLIPDWFVTCKIIKKKLLVYMQRKIYSILMKVLVMMYLVVTEYVFLV